MNPKFSLAMTILFSIGITACSGGNSTGAIPPQIQAGAVVTDSSETVAELQAKLAQALQAAEAAQQKVNELEEANSRNQNATNYLLGNTSVTADELAQALENGTALQQQATAENKNINSLIGRTIPTGTVLSTTANSYGGYAVVRENNSDNSDVPLNHYVAIAKTATTDKTAVIDAVYSGRAAMTTGNLPSILENTNQAENMYAFTLQVKNDNITGEIVNTNATIASKRAELGQPKEIITLKETQVQIIDNVVGFQGEAQFNYGYGFQNQATGDGKGIYQGVFTGENAQGVSGTFSTLDTTKTNSVQGAFTGTK